MKMIPHSKATVIEHQHSFNFCWGQFISAPNIADEEIHQFFQVHTSLQVMVFGGEVMGGPTNMFTLACISFSSTRWWVRKCLNFHCLNIVMYTDNRPSCNSFSYILKKQIFNLLLKPHIRGLNNPRILKMRVLFGASPAADSTAGTVGHWIRTRDATEVGLGGIWAISWWLVSTS